MAKPTIRTVAVIGTGVIGRCWIPVFARAGCKVQVFDSNPDQLATAFAWFKGDLKDLRKRKVIKKKEAKAQWERVTACESMGEALNGAGYVQESGPEQPDIKHAMYAELDRVAEPRAILGSSTSAIDMTEIAAGLPGAWRCIVAHPVNPPHLIPVVEVLGGAETDRAVVKATRRFLASVGQTPVLLTRFVTGFVLNRMQAALVREAVDLVATGVADVEAVDVAIREGLGLRWAFMGPYGVANTNADGGVREYFTRFRGAYHGMWDALSTNTRFDDALVEKLGAATDKMLRSTVGTQRAWRDRMIAAIRGAKARDPFPKDGKTARRQGGKKRGQAAGRQGGKKNAKGRAPVARA